MSAKERVSRLRKAKGPTVAPLRLSPPDARRQNGARSRAEVPSEGQPSVRRLRETRPAKGAWERICEPLRQRKGIRVLFYGITGKGKTHGIADLLDFILDQRLLELVIIHDVKLPEIQYRGEVIYEATTLLTPEGAPEEFPAVRILRKRNLDHMPSVETAARVTLESGYNDISTGLVVDEFQRALTDGGKFESPSVKRIFCEGLGMHASIIASKQLPQYTPTEASGQSTVVYFGLNGEGANFLADEKKITQDMRDVIRGLTVTQFVYVPQEGDWDGFVYEVPQR